MKRFLIWGAVGVGAGMAVSHLLGSRPEAGSERSPLPAVGAFPNAYASAPLYLDAPPEVVREQALVAVQNGLYPLFGSAESIEATPLGLDVVVALGPFHDDLSLAVLPDGDGTVVYARSAARRGRSDLGVNRLRTQRLLDDLARRANAAQKQLDGAARPESV